MNPGPPGLPRAKHDMSRALYLAELRAPERFLYALLSVLTPFHLRWEGLLGRALPQLLWENRNNLLRAFLVGHATR